MKESVSIQLKWKHSFQFAGYYAAIEQGYYEQEGLEVRLKEIDLSRDFVQDVLDGDSEYGVSDSSLALYSLQGKKVVLVSQVFQYSPLVLLSHKNSGITTPDDLIGKKVMYSLKSNGDTSFKALILKTLGSYEGVDIRDFTSYKDFIDGKVDVTTAYSTSQPFWLKMKGTDVNIIDPKSYGIDFYGDNFFTSQKELRDNPQRVEKMKRATLKGWDYALKHQNEIIDLILKKYSQKKNKVALEFEARGTYQMIMPDLYDIGSISFSKYNQVAKIYHQLGISKHEKIRDEFYYQNSSILQPIINKIELTQEEKEWIKKHPTIKVGGDSDWEPFDFVDNSGKYGGLSNDYLNLISEKTGLRFEVIVDKWSNNLKKMKTKEIDLLHNAYKNKKREVYLSFTDPYFNMLDYFYIRDDLDISSIDELNGKRVAIPRGYAHIEQLKKNFPKIKIVLVDTFNQAVDAVIENRAEILYDSQLVISYKLKKDSITNIIPFKSNRQYKATKLYMATAKNNRILTSIINKALKSMSENEKDIIYRKWIGGTKNKNSKISLSASEIKYLEENNKISFTGDPNWLPFEAFDKKGKYIGIVSEYLERIERTIDIEILPQVVRSWSETLDISKNRGVDIISGDIDDVVLAQNYKPTTPYFTTPIVIIMKQSQDFVNDLSDISDKKIMVIKGYGYTNKLFSKYKNIEFLKVENIDDAFDKLNTPEADALLLSMPAAAYHIQKDGMTNLKIVGKTTVEMHSTLFVNKEKPILYGIIEKSVLSISKSSSDAIVNKWQKVEFAKKIDYKLLYQITGILGLFLLGTVYWNRKLFKEVKERKIVESALEIEKENFKVLFEKVSDGNLIIQDGRFITCNQAAMKMLKVNSIEEILESTPDKWSPDLQSDGSLSLSKSDYMISICLEKGSNRFEWIHQDINGKEFWVDVGLTKIIYESREAIFVVWRDISEQKNLEHSLKESELQIRKLIDNIPLQIVVTTHTGEMLLANPKTLEDYNFKEEDLDNVVILDFFEDSTQREDVVQTLQEVGHVNQKIVKYKRHDGVYSMMISILSIRYGDEDAYLFIGVDLTERLNLEKDLNKAKETAELANLAKSEFLSNMSHEIRTPMNAIIGFTELLNEQLEEERLKGYAKTIQNASNSLLTLINDILDLSKIEAGKLTISKNPTDIHILSQEVASIFMMSIKEKDLDWIVNVDKSIPSSLLIDEVRLRQILLNLIGNAVKFTRKGFIKLEITAMNIDKDLSKLDLNISVEDSGIGIAENQVKKIFTEFEQSEGQDNRMYGGTGLGLSISKRLCEMMDGKINVESEQGMGSVFTVDLNNVEISSMSSQAHLENHNTQNTKSLCFKKSKILVVDDIEDNRELIIKNFENTEVEIVIACDGYEAIAQSKKEQPDLILMDIRMPNMDGFQAALEIKKISNVPIVALTASVMKDNFEQTKSKNFDGFLRKPVLKEKLLSEMSKFLKYDEIALGDGSKKEIMFLNKEAKLNLPIILDTINSEIKPLYNKAIASNNISDVKAMAHSLAKLTQEYPIDFIDKYVQELYLAVDQFDIIKIEVLLKKFLEIEKVFVN